MNHMNGCSDEPHMQIIRIIPGLHFGLTSAILGTCIILVLGLGSFLMGFRNYAHEFGAAQRTVLVAGVSALHVAIAVFFIWIHIRRQLRYRATGDAIRIAHSADRDSVALESSLEPHLDWRVLKPDWGLIGAKIDNMARLDQPGPAIVCVGAIALTDERLPPPAPATHHLWAPKAGYWSGVLLVMMASFAIVFTICLSVVREMPVNTLQILFIGLGGLSGIVIGRHMIQLSGARNSVRLELAGGRVEVVEARRNERIEVRRAYPLTAGTAIVLRVNPLFLGDEATLTFIRAGMADSVSLVTSRRTIRLFRQVLAMI